MRLRDALTELRFAAAQEIVGWARAFSPDAFPEYPAFYRNIPVPLSNSQLEFPQAAARVPVVYSCIDMLATDGAGLPVNFFRVGTDGKRTPIDPTPGSPGEIWNRMNPTQGRFEATVDVQSSLDTGGMGYLWIEKFGSEKPMRDWELWTIPPHTMKPTVGEHRARLGFEFNGGLSPIMLTAENVIYFRYWHPAFTPIGMSPLEAARVAYQTRRLSGEYGLRFYSNNAQASGDFSIDGQANLKPGELDAMQKKMAESMSPEKAFLPRILQGVKWERRGLTHQEMAFIETADLTDADICHVYGIPPVMLGIKKGGGLSDAGAKTDLLRYWEFTQKKRANWRDSVVTKQFCKYWGPDVICETDFSRVPALQESLLTQTKALVIAAGRPIMTVNEARLPVPWLEPVMDDPEADELFKPAQIDVGKPEGGTTQPDAADEPTTKSRALVLEQRVPERRRAGATLARYRRRFERAVRQFFTSQEAEVQDRVKLAYQMAGFDVVRGIRLTNGNGHRAQDPAIDIPSILGPDNEPDISRLRQIFEDLIIERGAEQLSELGIELEIALNEAFAKRYAERYAAELVTQINDTTRVRLAAALRSVLEASGTYNDAAAAVSDVFDGRRANSDTIARTEMVGAYNASSLDAARQSGVVTGKDWMSAEDELVRETHKACEAQGEIGLDDRFSNGLLFPGDPDGDAGEVCNCRCTLKFTTDPARVAAVKDTYRRTLQKRVALPDVPFEQWMEPACHN